LLGDKLLDGLFRQLVLALYLILIQRHGDKKQVIRDYLSYNVRYETDQSELAPPRDKDRAVKAAQLVVNEPELVWTPLRRVPYSISPAVNLKPNLNPLSGLWAPACGRWTFASPGPLSFRV